MEESSRERTSGLECCLFCAKRSATTLRSACLSVSSPTSNCSIRNGMHRQTCSDCKRVDVRLTSEVPENVMLSPHLSIEAKSRRYRQRTHDRCVAYHQALPASMCITGGRSAAYQRRRCQRYRSRFQSSIRCDVSLENLICNSLSHAVSLLPGKPLWLSVSRLYHQSKLRCRSTRAC